MIKYSDPKVNEFNRGQQWESMQRAEHGNLPLEFRFILEQGCLHGWYLLQPSLDLDVPYTGSPPFPSMLQDTLLGAHHHLGTTAHCLPRPLP